MSARRAVRAAIVALVLAFAAAPLHAVEPDEVLADRALETRARTISAEVRCVVCQNQSIDDSNAEIARDMRRAIRERLAQGDSDAQVIAFLRARYGDYVLLKPPFDVRTWLLWLGGPLALLIAALALWHRRAAHRPRRQPRRATSRPRSAPASTPCCPTMARRGDDLAAGVRPDHGAGARGAAAIRLLRRRFEPSRRLDHDLAIYKDQLAEVEREERREADLGRRGGRRPGRDRATNPRRGRRARSGLVRARAAAALAADGHRHLRAGRWRWASISRSADPELPAAAFRRAAEAAGDQDRRCGADGDDPPPARTHREGSARRRGASGAGPRAAGDRPRARRRSSRSAPRCRRRRSAPTCSRRWPRR